MRGEAGPTRRRRWPSEEEEWAKFEADDFDGLKLVADFVGVGVNIRESDVSSSNHPRLTSICHMRRQLLHKLVDAFVQFFYRTRRGRILNREMFPVSFSKWKSLEIHRIGHPVVSANDSSAALDEEFWTTSWLRVEAHWESMSYMQSFFASNMYSALLCLHFMACKLESSRIFAKRQVHPFFLQWKVGKSNPENYVPESNCGTTIGKDKHFKFNPIDVLEDIKIWNYLMISILKFGLIYQIDHCILKFL
ncbi:hypothetical protein Dimus_020748 [Dionaea muscipula]